MKKTFFILILSLFTKNYTMAQSCSILTTASDTTICLGDSVLMTAVANLLMPNQYFDFNGGVLPPGWTTSGTSVFGTPCGLSPNGTPYYWAATAGTTAPQVTTTSFDVSCGGVVSFDMVYAIQSDPAPCEGPDEADEGVELQYSIDGGITWIPIIYYQPDGTILASNPNTSTSVVSPGQLTPFTSWANYVVPIPPGAETSSTIFRWYQAPTSGASFDNWGLDNIVINASGTPCNGNGAVVNWDNGYTDTLSFYIYPTGDTTITASVYDTLGVFQCVGETFNITVLSNSSLTYNLVDTAYVYCVGSFVSAEVLNLANTLSPFSFSWSNGDITSLTTLSGTGPTQETIVNYVTITDGCGYDYFDSVTLIVNQTLALDSLTSTPSGFVQPPNCLPTGVVQAYVSGLTQVLGLAQYTITGPNSNPGGINVNGTSVGDLPPGWYYFTVTDDVCTLSDSVEVTSLLPPVAMLSANTTIGCNPLSVTFSNSSQNTVSYFWNFGNSNTLNIGNENSQSATYSNSTQVMLIAYDANNCSDTTYLNIDITECGCMDIEALNYNALAVEDDGSCVYPVPVVVAPNVFTPNGDTDNDVFFMKTEFTVKLQLTIINRWGNLMYENDFDLLSPGTEYGWNGLAPSGKEAEEGTYFYKYIATGIAGEKIEGHGFLHLVRDKK